jgi:hypothetical protein
MTGKVIVRVHGDKQSRARASFPWWLAAYAIPDAMPALWTGQPPTVPTLPILSAGAGFKHISKVLCRRNETSVAIDVRLADEISCNVSNDRRLDRIVDERRENIRKLDFGSRTKGRGDARSSAPHLLLYSLHGVIPEIE